MINKIIFLVFVFSLTNSLVFTQWVQQNSGTSGDLKSVYFVNPLTGWVCGVTGSQSTDRIAKTTDGGTTWLKQNAGTFYVLNSIQFINDQTGWAAGLHGTVVKTTNGGTNWFVVFGTTSWDWFDMQFVDSQTGWVAGFTNAIFKTTDGGMNWIGYPIIGAVRGICYLNDLVGWAVAYNGKINKTTNGGVNWVELSQTGFGMWDVFFKDINTGWICGSSTVGYGKICRTTNGGSSWDSTFTDEYQTLRKITFSGDNLGWVAGNSGKIYKTVNSGINWNMQSTPVNVIINALHFVDTLIGYSAGDSGNILKTTNGGGPVGLEQTSSEIPQNFSLAQNYPNPFNPSTVIRFNIAKTTSVRISIFDIQGKEVDIPVNQFVNPGSYQIAWNGANFPSGVYFYRFETEYFAETRKMILIK